MYDIIGDIHGYCDQLVQILKKIDYQYDGISWGHPDRKVIFVGDYIDRGPKIPETVNLVRKMVENDQAVAIMGNHELNAILFDAEDPSGGHIRKHSLKNFNQHAETLLQYNKLDDGQDRYQESIEWFKSLPIYFENDQLRVVHATWHHDSIQKIKKFEPRLEKDPNFILHAGNPEHELYDILENLLKGVEVDLPDEKFFYDKEDHVRYEMRIKWWKNPMTTPIEQYGFGANLDELKEQSAHQLLDTKWFYEDKKCVFCGHYWLSEALHLQSDYVCCVDYSIGREDRLVAYRFNGEDKLDSSKFEQVAYNPNYS